MGDENGWSTRERDIEREQGKGYLDKENHYGVREIPGARETPGNSQG